MDKRAFIFSLDATLCLVMVAVVIIATFISIANIKLNQHELLILQKEHDLLKHWLKTRASEGEMIEQANALLTNCLLYTSPSPRDRQKSRMPSSA